MRTVFFRGAVLGIVLMAIASPLVAQSSASAEAKTNAIAASFSKMKSLRREKRGVRKEKYLKVQSEPAALANLADYSGKYEVPDMNFGLDLHVSRDGSVTGTGYEALNESIKRTFTLRDGKIRGALLTATKVYSDGHTEAFEGAFMNRSTYRSPTDEGVTVFGFGTIGRAVIMGGSTIDKFFYQRMP
jgi:hypothetical protein